MQAVTYRDYQEKMINAVLKDWKQHTSVMLTAATGAGKTVVFLGLLDNLLTEFPRRRCLIIAHRKELIDQPIERMEKFWPHLHRLCGVVMAERNEVDRQIIVATVQTLNGAGRMDAILEHGPIDYVITDEAHHAVADSYKCVYERLQEANPNLRHLGVTATPIRADEVGMREVYEKESAHYGIKELVKLGYLAPPRWLAVQTGISLSGVAKSGSGADRDYSSKSLANIFETDNCFELVVESHKKFASGRAAICFTASVEGAYRLAEEFNEQGIAAKAADGTTPKAERAAMLDSFRRGDLQVLCNVALWTEGLDLPEISCVHMVRPTQSDAYYMQCIGRGLRLFPGKEDALILDYAPVETRNIVMLGDVLGLAVRKEAYVSDVEEGEVAAGFTFDGGDVQWMTGNPMEIVSRQLDYLNLSPWKWQRPHKTAWLVLGLGEGADGIERTLAISPPAEKMEMWAIWKEKSDIPNRRSWAKSKLYATGTFEELSEKGDELAHLHGQPALARKKQAWRKRPPSESQLKFAHGQGIDTSGMTMGDVADALTYKLSMDALRRGGANV